MKYQVTGLGDFAICRGSMISLNVTNRWHLMASSLNKNPLSGLEWCGVLITSLRGVAFCFYHVSWIMNTKPLLVRINGMCSFCI